MIPRKKHLRKLFDCDVTPVGSEACSVLVILSLNSLDGPVCGIILWERRIGKRMGLYFNCGLRDIVLKRNEFADQTLL